ncbi:hypothetical protein V7148_00220 [Gottfriedia acidiceleris]|uniref:hypothetical protein n=1 Tax=Bacillaceae TaxID=186817 RepID=UPI000BEB6099|nr:MULTISPECIES: hypothetical protein [unclassified Bacillus (in: firmicutes)]PEC51065.1 hypothetical protein CON00_03250 [Bacillus sp. AFS096315]PFM81232.1 hypothetical protein COJ46_09950 [Bacillus sp. AFS077874]
MEKFFRVILILILTFIVIVFTLIFIFNPVSKEISGSSKSIDSLETLKEDKVGTSRSNIISVEEQNMVENSSAQQGFVPKENGIGFYFVKNK